MRRGAEQSKKIAGERVERLLSLAEEVAKEDPKLSDRYVALAWRIKTKYNLRLPRSLKLRFCRRCLSYWKPGETSRVRIREGILMITCMRCGWIYRLPLPRKS